MTADKYVREDDTLQTEVSGELTLSTIDVDTSATSLVIDLCEDLDDEVAFVSAQPTSRNEQPGDNAPDHALRSSGSSIRRPGLGRNSQSEIEFYHYDQGRFIHSARKPQQQARLESNELGLVSLTGAPSGRASVSGELVSLEVTSNERVVARGPGGTFVKQSDRQFSSQAAPAQKHTKPLSTDHKVIVELLHARSRSDPRLDSLLKAVREKTATPGDRKLVHEYIEEAKKAMKKASTRLSFSLAKSAPAVAGGLVSPMRRVDQRPTAAGAATTPTKTNVTVQVIDLEEDSDDNIEVKGKSGEKQSSVDNITYRSLHASQIEHYGPVYPKYHAVLARASNPYVHAVCGQNYTTLMPVKVHHKKCGDGSRRWNEHPSCHVGFADLQIVRCMDGYVITSEQGYQRHEAAIRAGLDFVAQRDKALRSTFEASIQLSSTHKHAASIANSEDSALTDLSEEEVSQESSTGIVDYRHLFASQVTHFGPVYDSRWLVMSRADPAPYIHAACGQGYTHPESVRKHTLRSVCAGSRDRAWNAHPSCQIAYSDLNIGRCKDGWDLLDQGSHDRLEKAIAAGLQHVRGQLLAVGTGGTEAEDTQSMVMEIDEKVPAKQPTNQTVDCRHVFASQVCHFGPVYAGRWEILRRTHPAPYIHSACGKAYPHPSLVKQHATRHPCSHSAQHLWNQHPSCHIDYSDLKIGQCKDGWVLLDRESYEKVETAIAAGLDHIHTSTPPVAVL